MSAPPLGAGATDEDTLRHLFHGAVRDLEPSTNALDHLRRAVPARRARKRQALAGMAAAAVLVGVAIPALVHVANSGGGENPNSAYVGHDQEKREEAQREREKSVHKPGPAGTTPGSTGKPSAQAPSASAPGQRPGTPGRPDGTPGGGTDNRSQGGSSNRAAACDPGQLTVVSAHAAKPDAEGKVYGVFRVANGSGTSCKVTDAGEVGFQTMGAADRSKITVVDHTIGDAATGLPDPMAEASALVLSPDEAYEIRFAWVPSETCPTGGASPAPTATEGGGSGSGTLPEDQTSPQLVSGESTTQEGSVAVTHVAAPGALPADTTISNACAGTIYRTGMLSD
ncbi:hypothetical protein ACFVIM_17885 [Streptomyces sp. NPDC057638]|uniref:hypothetical protein n=1 Tax=Streptomyces sp. NPDC057638 TaxID=3346190 RepID=UPI00368CBFE4